MANRIDNAVVMAFTRDEVICIKSALEAQANRLEKDKKEAKDKGTEVPLWMVLKINEEIERCRKLAMEI